MEAAKRSSRARKKDNRRKTPVLDSDGNAFENVPLANEIQRLRKENEERNAELAIISSVQQGLASRLEFQSIIDLVGDQVRAITKAKSISIALYDKTSGMISWPYWFTLDRRIEIPDCPMEQGITRRVMYANKPLNLGTEQEILAHDAIPPQEGWTVGKSFLGVPFTVGDVILGALSLHDFDNEHAFNESDERLLQTLANSMSLALENARLFDETKRRTAELQIINSVQDGLATKLDMQAIYDLVGDKIREIFHHTDAEIRIYDSRTNLVHYPYITDGGTRIVVDPMPLTDLGMSSYVLRTGKTLVINENLMQEVEKFGTTIVPGGHPAKSAVFVPLSVNNQARGVLVLGNVEREHAFSESDVRLLETLANSMSTALENARLFDETQRLLKETEERNAELALINSVQSALAAKLNIQGIYDAVGDSLREIFSRSDVGIAIYNDKDNLIHIPYTYEGGKRTAVDSFALDEQGFIAHVLRTQETLVINENMAQEMEKYGSHIIEGTVMDKSLVYVPLLAGDQVRGVISIKDSQHEHAFSNSDVRLLTTIANSMSVALENARLFDETQSLLKETQQRNAELAIINSVQEGLASKLDMQAIYDLVGDKIRDLFNAQSVWIQIFDQVARTRQFRYGFYRRRLYIPEALPFNKLTEHLIAIKKSLVINQNADAKKAEFEMVIVAGSEMFKSAVFVPLIAGGEVKGTITLQSMEQENAFSESDINLLSTLASSMSVALENARLFDETQRLLKETEEHNAELAIITSVQRALASKLEMQAIYDLVGDKVRDVFDAQGVGISYYDRPTNFIRFPYCLFRGERITEKDFELGKGLTSHIIQSRQPLLINENAAERYKELGAIFAATESDDTAKSWLGVPLIAGGQVTGVIQLENYEREFAYSDSDVRLLTTLANSMSVALENARLFDETQRLLLETKEAHTAAEQANQAKSAFLSSMSHELRTPLNAIINFVEMIARGMIGPVNQEQVELLDQTLQSSKHLLNLINDVLDISKIQAGQLTLFIEDQVSVQVELEATLSIVGGLLQEKGLQLIRDVDPRLPMVSCDRRRLRQVLLNLISNAIKFTNEGTVTVSVKNQGREVLFAVIDTGPGIPVDEQDLIFEPFIQAENGERQVHGTGLGLPISRSLVRAHGGELWVDSNRGEGSAFFFTMPIVGMHTT